MAYLFKRARSPFWWIGYKDASGARRQKSTGFRHAITHDTRQARQLCKDMTVAERDETSEDGAWSAWVDRFLGQRYSHTPRTLARYLGSWKNIEAFLLAHGLNYPRQLSRQHVRDFIEWRQVRHGDVGVYEVCKNTALNEIKLLRIVMHEAVQCGFARVNPCDKLGIRPDAARKKPRITDAEHVKITRALVREPEWMQVSYAIAWEQGCRFSETCLPLSDVDLDRKVIAFRTKGRKDTLAEFPLSDKLVPLFARMKAEGRTRTFEMPAMPGKAWWRFFKRIKLSHLCFHSTRVTFVTRCYEAGLTREQCMRLVGHSTYAAHAVYPRLSADHQTAQAMRQLLD